MLSFFCVDTHSINMTQDLWAAAYRYDTRNAKGLWSSILRVAPERTRTEIRKTCTLTSPPRNTREDLPNHTLFVSTTVVENLGMFPAYLLAYLQLTSFSNDGITTVMPDALTIFPVSRSTLTRTFSLLERAGYITRFAKRMKGRKFKVNIHFTQMDDNWDVNPLTGTTFSRAIREVLVTDAFVAHALGDVETVYGTPAEQKAFREEFIAAYATLSRNPLFFRYKVTPIYTQPDRVAVQYLDPVLGMYSSVIKCGESIPAFFGYLFSSLAGTHLRDEEAIQARAVATKKTKFPVKNDCKYTSFAL